MVGSGALGAIDSEYASYTYIDGGAGGGGGYTKTCTVGVQPLQEIYVGIGAESSTDGEGNQTNIGDIYVNGGNAASGGSGGGSSGRIGWIELGDGGSDGSNGYGSRPGVGQGTTTRAFGESDGTLYAGGGGAFSKAGGAGGGGNGMWYLNQIATNGGTNTGGGSGGGWGRVTNYAPDAWGMVSPPTTRIFATVHGGSGIAIIRWGY